MDAERLLIERARRRLTVKELAEMSGVDEHTIAALERGERKPRATTVAKLADALGLDPAELLLGKEQAPIRSGPKAERIDERGLSGSFGAQGTYRGKLEPLVSEIVAYARRRFGADDPLIPRLEELERAIHEERT